MFMMLMAMAELLTNFTRVPTYSGKSWNFYCKIFRSWKIVLESLGNLFARSWKVWKLLVN